MTCWSSKVFCTFVREKIEIHLETWGVRFEEQYGFTEGGRIEQCLFTVNYVTNRTYESKKKKHKYPFFAFIDFSKAYDSIDRKKNDRNYERLQHKYKNNRNDNTDVFPR